MHQQFAFGVSIDKLPEIGNEPISRKLTIQYGHYQFELGDYIFAGAQVFADKTALVQLQRVAEEISSNVTAISEAKGDGTV